MNFSRTKLTAIIGLLSSVLVAALDLPKEVETTIASVIDGLFFLVLFFLRDAVADKNEPV